MEVGHSLLAGPGDHSLHPDPIGVVSQGGTIKHSDRGFSLVGGMGCG
jgi:hypothetical protein